MVYGIYQMWLQVEKIAFGLLTLLLAVVIAASGPAMAGPYLDFATRLNEHPPQGSKFRPDLEEQLDALLNAYRAEQGKKPVSPDPMFRAAARAHAADMMINNFMGHRASTGHDLGSRITVFAGDVTRFSSVGENAARDTQKTPVDRNKAKSLFAQWIKSRPHRQNLVSRNFQFVSTGVIQRGNSIWAVQIFYSAPRQSGLFQ
jgi:uncharacterized protein YkwD